MLQTVVKLEEIALDIQAGFAKKPGDHIDGISQIRTNNVSENGCIDLTTLKTVLPSQNEKEKYSLRIGDIIFNNTNSASLVGKTAFFDVEGEFLFSNHMTRIRVNEEIVAPKYVARYLHWFWASGGFQNLVTRRVNQAAINRTQLSQVEIPLPPIAEQRRIVEILDQADALRKRRAEADKIAERILPALFIKMFGDPASNPHDLDVVDLGELIEGPQNGLYKHASFYGEGTPILRIDSFYEGVVDTSKEFRRLRLTDEEIAKYALKENDVVINRVNGSRELFGKSALVPKLPEKTVFESNMMRFSVDLEKLDPVFTIQQLQTPAIRQQMIGRSKHINQYSVNQGDIRSLKILLPNLQLQKTFANRITSLQSLMKQQRSGQVNLETLFQTLLHRAFSGELTAEWRKAHMQELLQEMEHQAKVLGIEHKLEYEQLGMFE